MPINVAAATSLDVGTLFVIAICVTVLLGIFLLFAWLQERVPALAWWGLAYLIGALSGGLWRFEGLEATPTAAGTEIPLFLAIGMIWSAARLFHGRQVNWCVMCLGAAVWPLAWLFPAFAASAASRLVVGALIVAFYTFLIATELWRERRKTLIRSWPASLVPMLHGAVFLYPVLLLTMAPDGAGWRGFAGGWIAVFIIEVVLYLIGAAFIVMLLAKDRTVGFYKTAATTDPLTGVLNRRGFAEASALVLKRGERHAVPVSVLAFDLDHFKSINDRFGHGAGDAVLKHFAAVIRKNMRADDVIARLGGEEFIAVLPATLADAAAAAERVRAALAAEVVACDGARIAATVSVGVACASPSAPLDALIARADETLYRAKTNGRNRVELSTEAVAAPRPAQAPALVVRQQKQKGAARSSALQSCTAFAMREDAYAE
jgi:diguanylate cyclase (GGDEF)-like protein